MVLLYVKWDSTAVENRVVREICSLQCVFLKHYVASIHKLQKVMVDLFFNPQAKNVTLLKILVKASEFKKSSLPFCCLNLDFDRITRFMEETWYVEKF